MILVGYETGSKAYRLWNPATQSIVVSTNVRFDENMFPNKPATAPLTVLGSNDPNTIPDPIRI